MDKIIKQLLPKSDIYYVDHDRQTDTFRVKKDKMKIESNYDDDDFIFIKQTSTHPRDRLARRPKQNNNKEVRKSKRLAKNKKGRVVMPTGALLAAGKVKRKYLNKGERTKKLLKREKRLNNVAKKLKDPKSEKVESVDTRQH